MSRVSLSRRSAQVVESLLSTMDALSPSEERARDEICAALSPRPRSSAVKKTARKNAAKAKDTKAIRAAVMERAGGRCEHCGWAFQPFNPGELDHFFGRARAESVETCWALCRDCHREKTQNDPSAVHWLESFAELAEGLGYTYSAARARDLLRKHEAKASLSRRTP